jgi:hypothetical protein
MTIHVEHWLPLVLALLAGGLLLFFTIVRIIEAPISDTAKAVWVLIVFVVPGFGVLLPFVVLPKPDDDSRKKDFSN